MPDHYQTYLNDPTWNPPSGARTDSAEPVPITWEDILPMDIGEESPTLRPRNTGAPQRRSHVRRQDRPAFGNRRPPCMWERQQQRERQRARELRLEKIPYELRLALLEPDLHGHHLQAEIQRLASEKDYVGLRRIWKAASWFERYQEEERQEQARREYSSSLWPAEDEDEEEEGDDDDDDDDEEDEDAEFEGEDNSLMPPLRRVRARQESAPSDRPPTPYPRPSAPPTIPGLTPLPPIQMEIPQTSRDRQASQPPVTSEDGVYVPFLGFQDGDSDGLADFEREQAVAMLTEERWEARLVRSRRRRGFQLRDDEEPDMDGGPFYS